MDAAGAYDVTTVAPDIDPGTEFADTVANEKTVSLEVQVQPICGDHGHSHGRLQRFMFRAEGLPRPIAQQTIDINHEDFRWLPRRDAVVVVRMFPPVVQHALTRSCGVAAPASEQRGLAGFSEWKNRPASV